MGCFIKEHSIEYVASYCLNLGSSNFVSGSTNIVDLVGDLSTVLGHLDLHLVQLVHLLGHLRDGVSLLLLQADQGGFVHDVRLLEVLPQLGNQPSRPSPSHIPARYV